MEISLITKEVLEGYKSLLLAESVAMLEAGEPMLALGLVEDHMGCGAAAGWIVEDTLEIRSLYVAPEFRRKGGGKLLVTTMMDLAKKFCQNISISFTVTEPEHEALILFLNLLRFTEVKSEENIYRISVDDLKQSPFFEGKQASKAAGVKSFEEISSNALSSAYKKEQIAGENYLKETLTDPIVDQRVSCAVMEDGKIRSFAVFTSDSPDRIHLAWVKAEKPMDVAMLLRYSFGKLSKLYSLDTCLTVQAVNGASVGLIASIIPRAKAISHTFIRPING